MDNYLAVDNGGSAWTYPQLIHIETEVIHERWCIDPVRSDSGFIFQLYGFAYIREFELLREAGFHPLEIIRAATLNAAEALKMDKDIGSVAVGKKADFVLLEENPLENLKVLYGTGAIKLTAANEVVRVGGVKYTIRAGVIYDAKELLRQVKTTVEAAKQKEVFRLLQPGIN